MDVTLHAFRGLDGAHISKLPYTSLSWKDSINEAGSIEATVPSSAPGLSDKLKPYYTVIAAISDGRVLHAGYVTKVTDDPSSGSVSVSAGGGLTILEKRLVLNYALSSTWVNGTVLIDEDNPPGNWVLTLTGSYSDIVRGLIAETIKWGSLPITLPGVDGGSAHTRTYNSWDMATVADRIGDIGDLEDGPEIRLDPSVSQWSLSFALKVADEIVDNHWTWNVAAPGQQLGVGKLDLDGSLMCTQSFGTGGKDDDTLLVARYSGSALQSLGWPLMQVANTSHTTVTELSTLLSYVQADVLVGDAPQESFEVYAPLDKPVHVGDWADIRLPADGWQGGGVGQYKVTDVSGSVKDGRLTVSLTPRG